MIFLLMGPGGCGKTTQEQKISKRLGIPVVISTTDRPKRDYEVQNESYYFVTKEEFSRMIEEKMFVQLNDWNGNRVGVQREHTYDVCICVVQPLSIQQYIDSFGEENVCVIRFECTESICKSRMLKRNQTEEYALDRIEYDRKIFNKVEHKYVICDSTGEIEDITENLCTIITEVLDKNKS